MITAADTQTKPGALSTDQRLEALEAALNHIEATLVTKLPSKWLTEEDTLDILKISSQDLHGLIQVGKIRYSTVTPKPKFWKSDVYEVVTQHVKSVVGKCQGHGN